MPSQQSLPEFVQSMEAAGFLVRIPDEIRVDQIPKVLEANPTKAVLIEKIRDCEFSVLANAYSNQDMYAWAMECDRTETGRKMVDKAKSRVEAFIGAEPRAWLDILKHFHGQPYRLIYGAFGSLRHKLGRVNDAPWYRYTLSDRPFAFEAKPAPLSNFDPRHVGSPQA